MAISAQDVSKLREMTGVGMMDCKKALTATDGDMDKAIEFLREKGLATAQKKAGRIAAEGVAYAAVIDGVGVVVEVNAETDFVAKNEKFTDFVHAVAQETIEKVQVIGENIKIRRFQRFGSGVSVPYVHMNGRIGVLVNLDTDFPADKVTEVGKDLAMQIAALNPRFLDKSQVGQEVLDEEKKIMLVQMENDPKMAAKPDKVKEGIVTGKLRKFYEENCLMQQAFVKDDKVSVEQYVAAQAKALGGSIKLVDAVRFEKGEGIEKKQENFAEEIAKQLAK